MTAEEIAQALGGHRWGSGWTARCPAHDDRNPSLSIRETPNGKILVRCHAGCEQAQVIDALRARDLWPANDRQHQGKIIRPQSRQFAQEQRDGEGADRTAAALPIWQLTEPATNTLVETYLRSRGIDIASPDSLRFHPALGHRSGSRWPCMVALVTDGVEGAPLAIHRTYLARDGAGKAPVDPAKMMLGRCRGGVVRLAQPDSSLMIGEGIETCLSAMQATGHPAWAALSTSGLRSLDLPRDARDVIVLADGDEPGEAAAEDCARRWKHEGRRVRIARPPTGMDFNDMLMAFRADIALANAGPATGPASARVTAAPQIDQATVGDLPWR
jgi:putative DNA primase/helicase